MDPDRAGHNLQLGLASLLAVAILVSLPASESAAIGAQVRIDVASARLIEVSQVSEDRVDDERPDLERSLAGARGPRQVRCDSVRRVLDARLEVLSFEILAIPPPQAGSTTA